MTCANCAAFIDSELWTKSTASLEEDIQKDLEKKEPERATAMLRELMEDEECQNGQKNKKNI